MKTEMTIEKIVQLRTLLQKDGQQKIKPYWYSRSTYIGQCFAPDSQQLNQLLILGQSPEKFKRSLEKKLNVYQQSNRFSQWLMRVTGSVSRTHQKLEIWWYFKNICLFNELNEENNQSVKFHKENIMLPNSKSKVFSFNEYSFFDFFDNLWWGNTNGESHLKQRIKKFKSEQQVKIELVFASHDLSSQQHQSELLLLEQERCENFKMEIDILLKNMEKEQKKSFEKNAWQQLSKAEDKLKKYTDLLSNFDKTSKGLWRAFAIEIQSEVENKNVKIQWVEFEKEIIQRWDDQTDRYLKSQMIGPPSNFEKLEKVFLIIIAKYKKRITDAIVSYKQRSATIEQLHESNQDIDKNSDLLPNQSQTIKIEMLPKQLSELDRKMTFDRVQPVLDSCYKEKINQLTDLTKNAKKILTLSIIKISRDNVNFEAEYNQLAEQLNNSVSKSYYQAAHSLHPDKFGGYESEIIRYATILFQKLLLAKNENCKVISNECEKLLKAFKEGSADFYISNLNTSIEECQREFDNLFKKINELSAKQDRTGVEQAQLSQQLNDLNQYYNSVNTRAHQLETSIHALKNEQYMTNSIVSKAMKRIKHEVWVDLVKNNFDSTEVDKAFSIFKDDKIFQERILTAQKLLTLPSDVFSRNSSTNRMSPF